MARKGNRAKNGFDHHKSNKKYSVLESVDVTLTEKEEKLSHDRVEDAEDLPKGEQNFRSNNGVGKKDNTGNMGSGNKNKQRPSSVPSNDQLNDRIPSPSASDDMTNEVSDAADSGLLSDASQLRGDGASTLGSKRKLSNSTRGIFDGTTLHNVMALFSSSNTVLGRSLGSFILFISKAVNGWMERQKPWINSLTAAIHNACDYMHVQVKHLSPIIRLRVLQFAKVMFLLLMVWLDCSIRGLDSLLRLGTTSFFTVLWCTILSITAMVGIVKMLIIVVFAVLVGIFVGFALAVLLIALCSAIILWLYGSVWTTGFVVLLGGITFALSHERIALLIATLYSMYCARSYVGWIGLLFGLNLSFISSDILVHILKNNINEHGSNTYGNQAGQNQGRAGHFYGEYMHGSSTDDAFPSRSSSDPSTSESENELTSENEVIRLLNCNDHYSALGFARYENVDISILKREYKKKAMLVHPDKNMGNEKAAEAFKKLQNAYEVLLDSLKRKTYDDELRREEILNYFRRFQATSQMNGRHNFSGSGFTHFEAEADGPHGESRRIACKKCNDFHLWTCVERSKSQARWCQECKDFHQAKDGDGWVEQSFHPLLFGLLQKMEAPCAYVCADSRIYDATEWFVCQGMRCPANAHKPSFHVNTSVMSKHNSTKGTSSHRGGGPMPATMDETMTEEQFFEWFQNAVQTGMFEGNANTSNESSSPKSGSSSNKSNLKKKRKGKKQW
ncbi:hypothetical protein J5N97_018396 [Dioscorea zingiberensis]|uniref:J domain-containing protein n=1 Tax=Dioscorea zingiberensis TaxID=325984 RepID=A0A9D5CN07_9LILI|nr:hypothetical protein J5N97_018396 [Dioscorea zingiberensis]